MDSRAVALLLGLVVLAVAVALGACNGEEDLAPATPSRGSLNGEQDLARGSPSPGSLNGTDGPSLPSPSAEFPSLGVRLHVPSEVGVGEDVSLRLTVVSVGEEPLELGLGGHPEYGYPNAFNFFIETAGGEEVTCRLCAPNTALLPILSNRTLQPGEGLELGWDWDQTDNDLQPVPPGTYSVYGTFLALDIARNEERIDIRTESRQLVITP